VQAFVLLAREPGFEPGTYRLGGNFYEVRASASESTIFPKPQETQGVSLIDLSDTDRSSIIPASAKEGPKEGPNGQTD